MGSRNVVFVVDDDPGMLKGLKRLLREHGYDSVGFSSAAEFQNHNDFVDDPQMKRIDSIVLSYTFFKARYDKDGHLVPVQA